MHVESPWLVLVLLPMAAWVVWRSRPLEPAGRWLVRAATVVLCVAAIGVQVRCDRTLRIVAMVDVSPSTRGAAFREPSAVEAKLKQLVPRQRVEIRYFADGAVSTPGESTSARTRLPEVDADVVIVMSDGRFDTPDVMPPVYAVADPTLDSPADGRVVEITLDAAGARIASDAVASDASLSLLPIGTRAPVPVGPTTVAAAVNAPRLEAVLAPADAWPENNSMVAIAAPAKDARPWIITDASQLPADASAYLAPPTIAMTAGVEPSPVQAERLTQYVRDLGGSLVIVGAPRAIAPALRPISPLTGVPPTPEAEWMILLDASGSMAAAEGGESRWARALAAATDAAARLEAPQRVSLAVFARAAEMIAESVEPADAVAKLRTLAARIPTGPTGLDAALRSVADRPSRSPIRLLLITDADATIDSPPALIEHLAKAQINVFVLATGSITPDSPVRSIAERSGGALIEETDSERWSIAMRSLLEAASGEERIERAPLVLSGVLDGVNLEARTLYRAFERPNVETLARARDRSVAATWQVGLGRVTTIAADVSDATLPRMAERLQQSPADPRFAVTWNTDAVVLTATSDGSPMNGLAAAVLDGEARLPLQQTAPGRYEANVARSASPRIVRVVVGETLVESRALPGRYAAEFHVIGNDRVSLEALASRTGGVLIDASNTRPIDLPRATEFRPLSNILATIGLLTLGVAIIFIRAPYLVDRLTRYARRSVR